LELVEQVVQSKIGAIDVQAVLGTTGLAGTLKHLVIGNPISEQEDLLEILVIRKIKAVHMEGLPQ
jgi:hypothetical protein